MKKINFKPLSESDLQSTSSLFSFVSSYVPSSVASSNNKEQTLTHHLTDQKRITVIIQ